MSITFKVRENRDWYREKGKNAASTRWEVAMYDGREYAATCTSFATKEEAAKTALNMQADEDAGVTIFGSPADDHHASEAGLSSEVIKWYDELPARIAEIGKDAAYARHPWRLHQIG